MQSAKLLFELTGNIKRPEIESSSKSDFENEIDREYSDFEIVDLLNKESEFVQREIEEEIRFGLKKLLSVENISVSITFDNGSIIATGLVVIDILGKVSGAISFFEYANRLVKLITERVIKNVLRRRIRNNRFIVSIQATPISTPEELPTISPTTDSSEIFFNIPSSKLLIYITLINIIFFVGGALFNMFQVDSVQKRYNEANQKYLEVKTKYDSASQLVAYAKIKYQSDMESVVSDVVNKKRAILSSLSSDTVSISSDISLLNAKKKDLIWK